MKPEEIRSLWIRYNEDDNTYSVDIETKDMEISYPRANVQFLCGEYVAFPVQITTLDENMNIINSHSLISNEGQGTNEQPEAATLDPEEPKEYEDVQEHDYGEVNS